MKLSRSELAIALAAACDNAAEAGSRVAFLIEHTVATDRIGGDELEGLTFQLMDIRKLLKSIHGAVRGPFILLSPEVVAVEDGDDL